LEKKELIIELDGEIHCTQEEYDKYREAILREMGYTIIRFTNEEVLNNWDKVQADLKSILK
jgi:leucyl-tRNA synthetase